MGISHFLDRMIRFKNRSHAPRLANYFIALSDRKLI